MFMNVLLERCYIELNNGYLEIQISLYKILIFDIPLYNSKK